MDFESNGLNKEEMRKRRRKKERTQAFIVFGVLVLAVCLLLGGGIYALVHAFTRDDKTQVEETAQVAVEVEETEQPEEEQQETETESESQLQEETEPQQVEEEPAEEEAAEVASDEEPEQAETDAQAVLESMVAERIAGMTLEQKVAALFFVTPEQLMGNESPIVSVGSQLNERMNQYPVGGILLDESNFGTEDELSSMISNLQIFAQNELFIGVSDEGGENSPFITSEISENVISSQKEIGESLGTSGAYSAGISLGSELKQYGFNVDFAPFADVSLKAGSAAEKNGFGTDAQTTTDLTKNVVKGLTDQGIHSAVKYFPSYGDVTHTGESGTVISQRSLTDLQGEYEPYLEAIDSGAKFVVISHISLPKVRGDNRPASLSSQIITDIVRVEWEYDGIVITDFMDKSCMYQKYTYAEAAAGAIEAGADMILAPKNFEKSYNGVLDAVKKGTLTEERINESLTRIFRVKYASKVADAEGNADA